MRSVRRRPYFVSLISFSLAWGLLVFMLALPFTVSAAPVTYETTRVGKGTYVPNGVTSPITVNVKGPGVSKYHQIVPVVPPSTVGKFARRMVRGGPASLAVGGVIEGLGYLIDQATGDIKKIELEAPTSLEPVGPEYRQYKGPFTVDGWYPDPYSACNAPLTVDYLTFRAVDPGGHSCSYYTANGKVTSYTVQQQSISSPCAPGTSWNGSYCEMTGEPIEKEVLATADDFLVIDEALWNSLSLAQKNAIIQDVIITAAPQGSTDTDQYPVTISTTNTKMNQLYSDLPELRVLLQNLVNAQIASMLASSNPDFSPSPDEQTIINEGLDFLPPPPSENVTTELPAFCEWASWLCEPFVGGDQPDVPMLDLEVPDYDSGLPSGGTCPPPYSFSTGFTGPMEISFQPACDLASAIRTPLIAISYLMAGFIVVGVRR